jgi:hypothetical protein
MISIIKTASNALSINNSDCNSFVISLGEEDLWNSYIFKAYQYDFYHTHSYHKLDAGGSAALFVTENISSGDYIALPFILRRIPGSTYLDSTSVYGYPGPISNIAMAELPNGLVCEFRRQFVDYLNEMGVVSFITRLHPIIDQSRITTGLGETIELNSTVAMDLRKTPDLQFRDYRDSIQVKVKQQRKKGKFLVRCAESKQEIDEFVDIYTETMSRVNAKDYYFFSRDYFHSLLNAPDIKAYLLLAFSGNEIAAGIILTVSKDIMQAHLVATSNKFYNDAPMKLLFDEARLLANSIGGISYLHLGGGYGGKENDSLFFFKSSFSSLTFTYKVWTLILNQKRYDELVQANKLERELTENYFPLYRG